MASKRTVTRTTTEKREKAKAALRLAKRAQVELDKLLKRDQAGTISREELETELKEIYENLKRMHMFILASL